MLVLAVVVVVLLVLMLVVMVVLADGGGRCSSAKWQRVGQFRQIVCGICATIGQYLLALPFGSPVLVPGLHLSVGQAQALSQIRPILDSQILLSIELPLKCLQLEIGKCRPSLPWLLVHVHRADMGEMVIVLLAMVLLMLVLVLVLVAMLELVLIYLIFLLVVMKMVVIHVVV